MLVATRERGDVFPESNYLVVDPTISRRHSAPASVEEAEVGDPVGNEKYGRKMRQVLIVHRPGHPSQ
jgi:hypothetical protein